MSVGRRDGLLRINALSRMDAGAVLVQFGIGVAALVLIIMGVFDFGTALIDQSSLREATRGAARAASADQLTDSLGAPYSCSTTPTLASGPTANLVCLLHDQAGLPDGSTRVTVVLPSGADYAGDEIVVCSEHETDSVTRLFSWALSGKIQTTRVVVRAKQAAGLTTAGEEAFPHRDWSFCTA